MAFVRGTAGNNDLRGTNGDDQIDALDGQDLIRAFGGDDLIYGGGGHDLIFAGGGDDFIDGGSDPESHFHERDILSFAQAPAGITVNLSTGIAKGEGLDIFVDIEGAYGSIYDDRIIGSGETNFLRGGRGSDTIYGGSGDDSILGEVGNDALNGGSGKDYLQGGKGADIMTGGPGRDYFAVNVFGLERSSFVGNPDVITDWRVGQDYIELEAFGGSVDPGFASYVEAPTSATSIRDAWVQVNRSDYQFPIMQVFLYNKATDTGYLFAGDTGVILSGAGSAADMHWQNILSSV